jgi:geranylgeranyl pyrophosphate synthase
VHTRWDSNVALMVGDYLFALAAAEMALAPDPRIIAYFSRGVMTICEGELSPVVDLRPLGVASEQYLYKIGCKTAALFEAACKAGMVCGGGSQEQIDALGRFGFDLGIAFQIVDDVLDLRESTDEIGKPASLDLRQGTVTLPTMLFFQQHDHDGHEAELVRRAVNGDEITDDIYTNATAVIRESGALELAVEIAEGYVTAAKAALESIPRCEAWDMLDALADACLHRTR